MNTTVHPITLSTEPIGFVGKDAPTDEDLMRCVHCGLCLQQCPTYRILGLEADSPRGRLHMMREVGEKKRSLSDDVVKHLDLCVSCQACESVCPSGVRYGHLIGLAKAQIAIQRPPKTVERVVRWFMFDQLVPHPLRMRAFGWSLKLYQRLGLQALVHKLGILRLFPKMMGAMEGILPKKIGRFYNAPSNREIAPVGQEKYRVGFLTGCIMPLAYGETQEATVRVLSRNGCRVVVPDGQVCCGALHAHFGERDKAKVLARRNIDIFEKARVDFVVSDAAGCSAMMKEYAELLADEPAYAERAETFTHKVRDVTEFLAALPIVPPAHPFTVRVTLQEPCHLAHAQKIKKAPRDLIKAIPGVEFVEMRDSDRCCGSGGIYNITHSELADQLLDEKLNNIAETNAEIVVSANPGCMMQVEQGLTKTKSTTRLVHIMTLLDEAYANGKDA
jgi:glycolate oxidase iron-sulfur subunit